MGNFRASLALAAMILGWTALPTNAAALRNATRPTGPEGAQVIIDDPSGNPVELFQPRS